MSVPSLVEEKGNRLIGLENVRDYKSDTSEEAHALSSTRWRKG